jgi:hypothetical protein
VALMAGRPPGLTHALMTALLAVILAVWAYGVGRVPAATDQADFGQFYRSVLDFREGKPMYGPVVQGDRVVYNLNPPHFHLLVVPFTYLSPPTAFWLWLLAGLASLLLVLLAQIRWWRDEQGHSWALVLFAWTFATPMTESVFVTGAPVWILLPLVWGAWQADRRGRPELSGLLLGLTASVKPFLLVFLPWMVWRRMWTGVAAFLFSGAAWVVTGISVFGLESYSLWIDALRTSPAWGWGQLNASLWAPISRAFTPNPYWQSVRLPASPFLIWGVLVTIVLAVTYASLRDRHLPIDLGWSRLLVAALLTSTLGWIYYLWWLWPIANVWRNRPFSWAAVLALTVPPVFLFRGQPSLFMTLTVACTYTWGLAFLWLDLIVARRTRVEAVA